VNCAVMVILHHISTQIMTYECLGCSDCARLCRRWSCYT